MSEQSFFSSRESFILRVWRDGENPDIWRGQLQHTRSGETISIANLKNISVQLEKYLKKANPKHTGLK